MELGSLGPDLPISVSMIRIDIDLGFRPTLDFLDFQVFYPPLPKELNDLWRHAD